MQHRQAVEKIFMVIISLEQILRGLSYAVEEIPTNEFKIFFKTFWSFNFSSLCFVGFYSFVGLSI